MQSLQKEMGHIPALSDTESKMKIDDRDKHTSAVHSDTEVRQSTKLSKAQLREGDLWSWFVGNGINVFSILTVSRLHAQGQGQHMVDRLAQLRMG